MIRLLKALTSLIRSPLAMGVLTGNFDSHSALPTNDIRNSGDRWRPSYFANAKVQKVQDNVGAIAHGPLPTPIMDEIESLILREPDGEAKEL